MYNMKRIFISTNYTKLDKVIDEKRNLKGIHLIANFDLLFFNHASQSFQTEPVIETDLFLVKDESTTPFNLVSINPENDYLMHHNTIRNHTNEGFKGVHDKGMHEEGNKWYTGVFDRILDDDANKAERIIDFLFPSVEIILGKKLDLLHSLLVPPVDTTEANAKWANIRNIVQTARASGINVSLATDENALTTFQNKVNGMNDPFDPRYIEALTDLRDALLTS